MIFVLRQIHFVNECRHVMLGASQVVFSKNSFQHFVRYRVCPTHQINWLFTKARFFYLIHPAGSSLQLESKHFATTQLP